MDERPASPYHARRGGWKVSDLRVEARRRKVPEVGTREELLQRLAEAETINPDPATKYAIMNVLQLRDECRERSLSTSGLKADLINRLQQHDQNQIAKGEAPFQLVTRSSELSQEDDTKLQEDDNKLSIDDTPITAKDVSPKMAWQNIVIGSVPVKSDPDVVVSTTTATTKPFQFSPSAWTPKVKPPLARSPHDSTPKVERETVIETISQSTSNTRPNITTTTITTTTKSDKSSNTQDLQGLRQQLKKEIENLVVWKQPVRTLMLFFQWCYDHVMDNSTWLIQRYLSVIGVVLVAVGCSYLYTLEANQHFSKPFEAFILWYGGWVLLGIASSFGVGTGVHTFLLYLGPFIAATALRAEKCGNLDFTTTNTTPWPRDPFAFVCHNQSDEQEHVNLIDLMAKVRWEAFAWGLGTALGELPPFFFARAARLAGEQLEDHDDLEELSSLVSQRGWRSVDWSKAAKVACYRVMKHTGFFGIMILASVPNPLFDLAGIFSGYMLISFWTFFTATFVGKAINKVSLQTWFVIAMINGGEQSILIQLVKGLHAYLPSFIADNFLNKIIQERERYRSGTHELNERGFFSFLFDLVLVGVLLVCAVTIIHSLAQAKLKQKHDEQLALLQSAK